MLQELERAGESQISLTDPDSRAMALNPKVGVGFNAQVAVDSKHKLIVEQEVTNACTDLGLLAPTASAGVFETSPKTGASAVALCLNRRLCSPAVHNLNAANVALKS
jgi:hypothetical protein